jgi:hypothetical protein
MQTRIRDLRKILCVLRVFDPEQARSKDATRASAFKDATRASPGRGGAADQLIAVQVPSALRQALPRATCGLPSI